MIGSAAEGTLAVDLQCVFPQETIRITSVKVVAGSVPTLLDVVGDDFSSVDTVDINEIEAPSFIVLSLTRMLVTLPEAVAPTNIRTVTVVSRRLMLTSRSLLRFQVSKVPSKASGTLRLLQLFLKVLLTTPGSDKFNKQLGGGGLGNLGQSFGRDQSGVIVSDFVVSVQNTTRQIIALQGRSAGLPPEERLLNAKVLRAQFSAQEAALLVSIEVSSQTGRAAVANVVV